MSRVIVGLLFLATVLPAGAAERYWIVLLDKGPGTTGPTLTPNQRAAAINTLTPRALKRRAKVLPPERIVDAHDLPIYPAYLDSLRKQGIFTDRTSRWFNAVSFEMNDALRDSLRALPFVLGVVPVRRLVMTDREREQIQDELRDGLGKQSSPMALDALDFGNAYAQLHLSGIDSLQLVGITGNDVLLGHIDTGARWRALESTREARVIGEYDFVMHDSSTANDVHDDDAQDNHGSLTFSTISGYTPGNLIGGAFNAQFMIAKTEDIRTETHVEEDNYAAALEWMEAQGVDVTTSSLGYTRFDSGQVDYTIGDLNGHTTIVAQAVARAARLGVCVFTAAGNNGATKDWPYVSSPADADSIIAVGAVDSNGVLAKFSSRGPTADGRIKPDICAMGALTYGAEVPGPDTYGRAYGTSLSTPIAASCGALLLSAFPELTPVQIRDLLRASGDHAARPDTAYGWGTANVFHAALAHGVVISNPPRVTFVPATGTRKFVCGVAAEEGVEEAGVVLHYKGNQDETFRSAQFRRACYSNVFTALMDHPNEIFRGDSLQYFITARTNTGREARMPRIGTDSLYTIGFRDTTALRTAPLDVDAVCERIPYDYSILQNYPNPFKTATTIRFGTPKPKHGTLELYNVLGQHRGTLFSGDLIGLQNFYWNAPALPAGVYFVWMRTPGGSRSIMVQKTAP